MISHAWQYKLKASRTMISQRKTALFSIKAKTDMPNTVIRTPHMEVANTLLILTAPLSQLGEYYGIRLVPISYSLLAKIE